MLAISRNPGPRLAGSQTGPRPVHRPTNFDNVYVVNDDDGRSSTAELLRAARERASLTQEQLAIRAGTKQAAISRIESGAEKPTVERLRELLWVTGLDLDFELRRRPIPADPDSVWHNLGQSLDKRAALALGWNEFGGELSEAAERLRREELERLLEESGEDR